MNNIILRNCIRNKEYVKKVLPYLKSNYFDTQEEKIVFQVIRKHIVDYKSLPTSAEILVELSHVNKISEGVLQGCQELVSSLNVEGTNETYQWLLDSTEKWIRHQALTRAILASADMLLDKKDPEKINGIPVLIQDALKIQFNTDIGIEFLDDDDIAGRWKKYHEKIYKFPTGISALDHLFEGGIEPKSVSILLSSTNAGKTNAKISIASNMLREGHDVLYVTLEMSEEKITQRFDANFLQIPINDVGKLEEQEYISEVTKLQKKSTGRLIVKNYPPASITAMHIRSLLDELEMKKGFKPKIVVIDYINLMLSSRYKAENLYTTMKSILEEVRAIAVELDIAILTSTQGNRETNSTVVSDIDLTNISESYGVGSGADAIIALIFPDDLRKQNLQRWKILKNRFGCTVNVSFMVGIDFKTATVFDVDAKEFKLVDKADTGEKKTKKVKIIIDEEAPDTMFTD